MANVIDPVLPPPAPPTRAQAWLRLVRRKTRAWRRALVGGLRAWWQREWDRSLAGLPRDALLLLAIALSLAAGTMAPFSQLAARGDAARPMPLIAPLVQVQLARHDGDLRRVLDTPPTTPVNIADARTAIAIDSTVFIPLYVAFFGLAALLIARGDYPVTARWQAVWLIALAFAAWFDWRENSAIEATLSKIATGSPLDGAARSIRVPALAKWMLLVGVAWSTGIVGMLQTGYGFRKVVGIVLVTVALAITMDLVSLGVHTFMSETAGALP